MKCNTTLQRRYPNDKETISSYPGVLSCTPLKRKEARDEEELALESGQSFPCGPAHEHPIEVWEALELRSQMTTGRTKQAQNPKWQLKVCCFVVVRSCYCVGWIYFLGFRKEIIQVLAVAPGKHFWEFGNRKSNEQIHFQHSGREWENSEPKFRSWKGMIKIIPEIDKNRIGRLPVFGIEE